MNYLIFAKFITDQNINLIFNLVGMYDRARKWNRKNISNYLEIYIKTDIKKIIQFNKKKIYHQKIKNIVGIDIKAEYPKTPHIIINNNFTKSIDFLSKELIKKIIKKIPSQK
jgi:adenylylsulfate kinase-like enzyme